MTVYKLFSEDVCCTQQHSMKCTFTNFNTLCGSHYLRSLNSRLEYLWAKKYVKSRIPREKTQLFAKKGHTLMDLVFEDHNFSGTESLRRPESRIPVF